MSVYVTREDVGGGKTETGTRLGNRCSERPRLSNAVPRNLIDAASFAYCRLISRLLAPELMLTNICSFSSKSRFLVGE